MCTNPARVTDPNRNWMFQDDHIRNTVTQQSTRLIAGAVTGLPIYPAFAGDPLHPDLARDTVVLADGSAWLYADDVTGSILTPDVVGSCHHCGERDRIEGVFHVAWRRVIVEFAYCVGCMADLTATATRLADALAGQVVVTARQEA